MLQNNFLDSLVSIFQGTVKLRIDVFLRSINDS